MLIAFCYVLSPLELLEIMSLFFLSSQFFAKTYRDWIYLIGASFGTILDLVDFVPVLRPVSFFKS